MLRGLRRPKSSAAHAPISHGELPEDVREFLRPADPATVARATQSWDWADFSGKSPLFVSLLGHVIYTAPDGLWVLDPIDGSFEHRWSSVDDAIVELSTEEGQDEHLLAGLAMGAQRRGMTLDDGQVWELDPPPVLGGRFDIDNLRATDLEACLEAAGQRHAQIRASAPATEISDVTIDD